MDACALLAPLWFVCMCVFFPPKDFQEKNGVGNWSWNGSEAFGRKGERKNSVEAVAWIELVLDAGFGADPSSQRI